MPQKHTLFFCNRFQQLGIRTDLRNSSCLSDLPLPLGSWRQVGVDSISGIQVFQFTTTQIPPLKLSHLIGIVLH